MLSDSDRPSSSDQAVAYIHEAARADLSQAQYLYMMIREEGIVGQPWPQTVLWWGQHLRFAARAGQAESQWYWSLAEENGWINHADPQEAWKWISEAAYKGFPSALDAEGTYFSYGLAGERDPAKALRAYQIAAQSNAHAMQILILGHRMGIDAPQDAEKADYYLAQLRLRASRGDDQAEYYLGDLYRNGILLPQSYSQALTWYQRAADNGLGQAWFRIAEMYESGDGVPKNPGMAFRDYRKAACLYYLPAFYNVSVMTAEGIGTPKNSAEAREWFNRVERGAKRGASAHRISFARFCERGIFVPRNEAAAAAEYQSFAVRGDLEVERALAKMILDGRGVRKDPILAYCWLDHAARHGDGRAKRMRDTLTKAWPSRQRAEAQKSSLAFHPENTPIVDATH
jgi:TPR repeat protein